MEEERVKKCSHCKEVKPISKFSARKASQDGLSYNCKDCDKELAKESYLRRKKKRKQREYYEENREHLLELSAKNYQENKEVRLQQHKEYRQTHPETPRKADAKRRRALKQTVREPYTREEIIERDSVDGICICQICFEPILDMSELQLDHIVPVAEGGTDTKDNIRCAHRVCNAKRPKDGRDLVP
jgi:hypothetical protein